MGGGMGNTGVGQRGACAKQKSLGAELVFAVNPAGTARHFAACCHGKTCHQTAGLTRKMRQTETHSSELANWQIDAIQKGIEQANRGELVEHACVKAKWQMRLAEATQSNRSLPKPVAAHTNEAKDS